MAQQFSRDLDEELMCHICTEIYKDPVQLACQHSFCRECLRAYVSFEPRADTKEDDTWTGEKTTATTGELGPITSDRGCVCCPVCRTLVDIDSERVSRLPVHFTLANIVEKYQTRIQREEEVGLKCGMCDGDRPKSAVKGCVMCGCLYCQDCLKTCHPMRGPLSKHTLVEPENYATTPICEEHDEPLKMYCGDCQKLVCLVCTIETHKQHGVQNIKSAYDAQKDNLTRRASQLRKVDGDLRTCTTELTKLETDIKQCFDTDSGKVEMKYQNISAKLEQWRSGTSQIIEKKRDSLLEQTKVELTRLHSRSAEIPNCLEEIAKGVELKDAVSFLREHASREFTQRLDSRIRGAGDSLKAFNSNLAKIRNDYDKQPVPETELFLSEKKKDDFPHFMIRGQTIACPDFSMKKEVNSCVTVKNKGKHLINVHHEEHGQCFPGALADQSFQTGRLYWEIDVTFTVKVEQPGYGLVYAAGVIQQGYQPTYLLGSDPHSWGVWIQQESPYTFAACHNRRHLSYLPVYPDEDMKDGMVRQGLYLDCENKTFTILDCTHDRVLCTFCDVDVSKPLIPAVAVYNLQLVDVSARLRTGQDIVTPPSCLFELLQG